MDNNEVETEIKEIIVEYELNMCVAIAKSRLAVSIARRIAGNDNSRVFMKEFRKAFAYNEYEVVLN